MPQEDADHFVLDNYDGIKIYIDALGASAARCRRMLVVLAVASVLFFAALWNSRQDSWLNLRIRTAQACLREKAYLKDAPEPKDLSERENYHNLRAYLSTLGLFGPGVTDRERFRLLNDDVDSYRKLKRESVILVHVPLSLSVFDVNDLGIMAGITFSLLLMGYWFSVTRERDTLYHSFAACQSLYGGSSRARRLMYDMLSTSQVLNVPNTENDELDRDRGQPGYIKKYLAKMLVLPPFLIQAAIIWNDQGTLQYGFTLGQHQTSISLMIEGVLLFVILTLTVASTQVSMQITKAWDREFEMTKLSDRRMLERRQRWVHDGIEGTAEDRLGSVPQPILQPAKVEVHTSLTGPAEDAGCPS